MEFRELGILPPEFSVGVVYGIRSTGISTCNQSIVNTVLFYC